LTGLLGRFEVLAEEAFPTARMHPINGSTPAQLTLDDWAQMLSADREQARTSPPERTESKSRIPASVLALESATPPVPTDLLERPDALLTRTRLRELGLERRAVDAIFRALPVVAIPGYARPMIRAQDYLQLVERYTYRDDRVRPAHA
jgi:hypothetical protein